MNSNLIYKSNKLNKKNNIPLKRGRPPVNKIQTNNNNNSNIDLKSLNKSKNIKFFKNTF
jgi:hypothetical protein